MRLDRFDRIDDFLASAGAHLAAREAQHNLILGIASTLQRNPGLYDAPPYLAVVRDGATVVAAALRTPPYNLILSEVDDPAAVALLVDDLAGEQLPGVTGPPAPARDLAAQWTQRNGGSWRVQMEERVYALSALAPPRPVSGSHRLAVPADRELVKRWLHAFGDEVLGGDRADPVRRTLDDWLSGSGRRFWLWEDGGEAVALVGAGGETPNGIRIGPVYTPPDRRGRGFASNLTAAVTELMLKEGRRFCFLYTDLANPTSNRIYRAIGYEPVTDALMVSLVP